MAVDPASAHAVREEPRRRYPGWRGRLAVFTQEAVSRPFKWGEWDCALAAAAEVRALTGLDFAGPYLGYADRDGAASALARVAGGGLAEAATLALGAPWDTPRLAQVGDIVLVETLIGPALGWSIGDRIASAGPRGLTFVSPKRAKMAWHV